MKTIEALKKVRKAKQDHEKRSKPQETTKATESPEVHAWSEMLSHAVAITGERGVRCFELLPPSLSGLRRVMVAFALQHGPTIVGTGRWQPPSIEQLHRPSHLFFLLCVSVGQRSTLSAAININSRLPSSPTSRGRKQR